jgi:hypothetical protein
MEKNRRGFIKLAGIAGAGIFTGCSRQVESTDNKYAANPFPQTYSQRFNMSGYAAPKLETVRIGFIGIGNRGSSQVRKLASIEGVEIKAVCDIIPERAAKGVELVKDYNQKPDSYSGSEDEWKKVCDRKDIDLVYLSTPWPLHTPMAVYAMEHEIHVATDRPAATTIKDCWRLVETSERNRKHCWISTHGCFSGMGAVTLNMVRQGFFGELIHGEGAYIHDRMGRVFDHKYGTWRLKENATRNGFLYPDSAVDCISQMMDINCGDKMDYLSSLSSIDFMMGRKAREIGYTDETGKSYNNANFRGNMNITIIRTNKGRSIMIQHDVTSPRPRPNTHDLISGTKGICLWSVPKIGITGQEDWMPVEEVKALEEKYTPEMTKRFNEIFKQAGNPVSSDSGDNIEEWRLIDCLRNGIPMDVNVYDAALYASIGPLSEWSVANQSSSVVVPDFTCGAWKTNNRGMDIELQKGGGTTKLVKLM